MEMCSFTDNINNYLRNKASRQCVCREEQLAQKLIVVPFAAVTNTASFLFFNSHLSICSLDTQTDSGSSFSLKKRSSRSILFGSHVSRRRFSCFHNIQSDARSRHAQRTRARAHARTSRSERWACLRAGRVSSAVAP